MYNEDFLYLKLRFESLTTYTIPISYAHSIEKRGSNTMIEHCSVNDSNNQIIRLLCHLYLYNVNLVEIKFILKHRENEQDRLPIIMSLVKHYCHIYYNITPFMNMHYYMW
jgi:hypothetical protein